MRGRTLVEIVVVLAVVTILGMMLWTGWAAHAAPGSERAECANRLRSIALAAQMYADDKKFFPWCEPVVGGDPSTISEPAEARACLALLYKCNYVDETKVYICPASHDAPADPIDDLNSRKGAFVLAQNECSYTWRNRITRFNDDSKTPLSADFTATHEGGRNVAFTSGQVVFYDAAKLGDPENRDVKRFKKDLVGFDQLRVEPVPPAAPADAGKWVCPKCQNEWPAAQKLCGECGAANPARVWGCEACGVTWPERQKFCGDCGKPNGSYLSSKPALSDDDAHKLYQAAAITGDNNIIIAMYRKLGLASADGRLDYDAMQKFTSAHGEWAQKNVDFIKKELSRPEKARAYWEAHGK